MDQPFFPFFFFLGGGVAIIIIIIIKHNHTDSYDNDIYIYIHILQYCEERHDIDSGARGLLRVPRGLRQFTDDSDPTALIVISGVLMIVGLPPGEKSRSERWVGGIGVRFGGFDERK